MAVQGEAFEGLGEVRKALREAGGKDAVNELKKGLRLAGKVVADDAKRRAPRRTGALRRGIRATVKGAGSNFRVEVVAKRFAAVPARPYSHRHRSRYPLPYPVHLRMEFEGGAAGPGGIGRMPGPRAFLAPAVEENRAEVRSIADEAMRTVIRKWTGET